MRRGWTWGLGLLAIGASGCVGTPVPQPPVHQPPDPTGLVFDGTSSVPEIRGAPGSAEPGTRLWLMPLDQLRDPALATVSTDGSFSAALSVPAGEEIRLQVRSDAGRSRPVDVRSPDAFELARRTEGCLLIALEVEADPVEVGSTTPLRVEVENGCGGLATIASAALRRADPAFGVESAGPIDIPDGASAALTITFRPDAPGPHEEILFLEVSAPELDRRPVTLLGTGR